jgi:hypothetical protein
MYKEKLAYQPLLDSDVILIVDALQDNSMSKSQFHSKKKYWKRKGDLVRVLKLAVAWEICQNEEV